MTMLETGIAIFIIFCLLLACGPFIANRLEDAVRRDGGHQRRYDNFMRDARRRGLSAQEANAELKVRTAFARLRRIASNRIALMKDLDGWMSVLETTTKEVAEHLGRQHPELVQPFLTMVGHSTYADICYPAEKARIDAHSDAQMTTWKTRRPGKDEFAALRIV